ncbi:prophage pi2 protein 39 [Bacillus mycoides]|uniref:Prophage pi2 protein 39 n=1 Tax=Bacillus mycoides TaxID=1405 RepID=A0A1E8B8R3_BACMY|nr:prophage pi2 protein 39 [Bacillus mycoides]OFD80736.1 prophage pi2 protein 39 [Bacillus mycoides]OFD83455.1 prophage pi2 protein 39 [Bacillus mycoides]
MENKVQFGLKNVHYATFEEKDGVVTFETPTPLPGGVELTFEPRGDLIEFYADDMLYYAASNNQGYDGTLSIASIPEKFAIDALGEQLDEVDGVLNELADAKGKSFALLFEFDGDKKQLVMLCITVQRVVQHLHLKQKQTLLNLIQMN